MYGIFYKHFLYYLSLNNCNIVLVRCLCMYVTMFNLIFSKHFIVLLPWWNHICITSSQYNSFHLFMEYYIKFCHILFKVRCFASQSAALQDSKKLKKFSIYRYVSISSVDVITQFYLAKQLYYIVGKRLFFLYGGIQRLPESYQKRAKDDT